MYSFIPTQKKRDYVMKEIKRINEQIQELAPKKKAESKSG